MAKMVIGLELDNGEKMLLSEEAAKEIYEKLKKVFEDKERTYFVPVPYYIPQPIYIQPIPVYNPWPTWVTVNTCTVPASVTIGASNLTAGGCSTSGYLSVT